MFQIKESVTKIHIFNKSESNLIYILTHINRFYLNISMKGTFFTYFITRN